MKNKEGILFSYFKMFEGLPSWSSGLDSMLSLQGAWAKKKKSLKLITVVLSLLQEQLLASIKDNTKKKKKG